MTALAEALLAAQRQALGALGKVYLAGVFDTEDEAGPRELVATFEKIGCTDLIDRQQLLACLDVLRDYGAPAPPNGKPDPATEPASDRQMGYIRDLADEHNTVAPDGPLTKAQASKVIEQLKSGTYNADEWTAPF